MKIFLASAPSTVSAISVIRRLVALRDVGRDRLYSLHTIWSHAEKSVSAYAVSGCAKGMCLMNMRIVATSPVITRNLSSLTRKFGSLKSLLKSSSLKDEASVETARTQCAMVRSMSAMRLSVGSSLPLMPHGPTLVEIQWLS